MPIESLPGVDEQRQSHRDFSNSAEPSFFVDTRDVATKLFDGKT